MKPGSGIQVHAATNPGAVRERNEDAFLLSEEEGLFAVFDGMGGHSAGEVAARMARDVVLEYVRTRRNNRPPKELLERALKRASGLIYDESRSNKERRGMGTTAVVCLLGPGGRAFIAHVGDSRAYLMRAGRLRLLTRDHTVVSELLARGALTVADAVNHPYKSVLSRNLGGKPSTDVDSLEVVLEPGDRLLLCSDGLTGFASHDAVEQVLSGAEDAKHATVDLIELALRGGGGDNVTAVVLESGRAEVPRTTTIVRTSGAPVWWGRREQFLAHCRSLGVGESPVRGVMSEGEALEILAGNLCEAIFRDLEQTTGIHVWTYTENLVKGWLDQGGSFHDVCRLLETFRRACSSVVNEIGQDSRDLADHLDVAVTRALIVAEMCLTGIVASELRELEAAYARDDLSRTLAPDTVAARTLPFFGGQTTVHDGPSADSLLAVLPDAHGAVADNPAARDVLSLTENYLRGGSDTLEAALDVLGEAGMHQADVARVFDGLDAARAALVRAVRARGEDEDALTLVARTFHELAGVFVSAVEEMCRPVLVALERASEKTQDLRDQVGRQETQINTLERGRQLTEALDPEATIPDNYDEGDL